MDQPWENNTKIIRGKKKTDCPRRIICQNACASLFSLSEKKTPSSPSTDPPPPPTPRPRAPPLAGARLAAPRQARPQSLTASLNCCQPTGGINQLLRKLFRASQSSSVPRLY